MPLAAASSKAPQVAVVAVVAQAQPMPTGPPGAAAPRGGTRQSAPPGPGTTTPEASRNGSACHWPGTPRDAGGAGGCCAGGAGSGSGCAGGDVAGGAGTAPGALSCSDMSERCQTISRYGLSVLAADGGCIAGMLADTVPTAVCVMPVAPMDMPISATVVRCPLEIICEPTTEAPQLEGCECGGGMGGGGPP